MSLKILNVNDRSATLPPGLAIKQIKHEDDARSQTNLEVRTSSGLVLDLLTDRALDIGAASYRGTSIAWTKDEGFRHPLELPQNLWRDRFVGGLVATCGLDNVGPACVDVGIHYPQHGQIGGQPAKRIRTATRVISGRRYLIVRTEVKQPEAALWLHRTLIVCDDLPLFRLIDTVVNDGDNLEPVMIQYHCNFGRPIVRPGGTITIPGARTTPRDAAAAERLESWQTIDAPIPHEQERVFRHEQPMQRWARAFLATSQSMTDPEWSIGVRYDRHTLPWIWQWRLLSSDSYVIGLEPANCDVKPRSEARRQNALPVLAAHDQVTVRIEIGVSTGSEHAALMETGCPMG